MGEIKRFAARPEQDQKDCIRVLEDLLAQAHAGQLRSVVVGYIRPDGNVGTDWSSSYDTVGMLAAAGLIFTRLMVDEEP